jgi:hypothetical protein
LSQGQVLIASPEGSTTHRALFELATGYYYGASRRPLLMPRFLSLCGLYAMNAGARFTRGPAPFEQPWMLRYVDRDLRVGNRRTRELLEWSTYSRHQVERRIPYLVERLRSEPFAWHARNLKAMRRNPDRPELQMHTALAAVEERVCVRILEQFTARGLPGKFGHSPNPDKSELFWFARLLYRLLLTSLYTGNRMLILNYFEVSAHGRFEAGYSAPGLASLLRLLKEEVLLELDRVEKLKSFGQEKHDCVTIPIEFGVDEVEQQYDNYLQNKSTQPPEHKEEEIIPSARDQLEDTIWRCLVLRK